MAVEVLATLTPLLLAALGGWISERVGTLNISLEGGITLGAFVTAWALQMQFPLSIALSFSLLAGLMIGMFLAFLHLRFMTHLFITGLGINLLIPAVIQTLSQRTFGHKGTLAFSANAETLILLITVFILTLPIILGLMMKHSHFGTLIRATGSDQGLLAERGYSVSRIRGMALALSSAAAALAGSLLVLRVGAYVPGMGAGRGWIALVLVWLGFRRPMGILLSTTIFAFLTVFGDLLQGYWNLPPTLFLGIPHILALLALILASGARKSRRREPL
ncbi:MAG: hypothetical protein MI717_13860 [Spirochaetales bacterium]|nr:hypothetical protein [Spirochaetales bacterium]